MTRIFIIILLAFNGIGAVYGGIMLRDVHFLQVIYGMIGLTLMILGTLERKKEILEGG